MTRKAKEVDRGPGAVMGEEPVDNIHERVVLDIEGLNRLPILTPDARVQRVDDGNDPGIGCPQGKQKGDLGRNRPSVHLRGPVTEPRRVGSHPGDPAVGKPVQLVGATEKAADFGEVFPWSYLRSGYANLVRKLTGSGETLDAGESEVPESLPNRIGSGFGSSIFTRLVIVPGHVRQRRIPGKERRKAANKVIRLQLLGDGLQRLQRRVVESPSGLRKLAMLCDEGNKSLP